MFTCLYGCGDRGGLGGGESSLCKGEVCLGGVLYTGGGVSLVNWAVHVKSGYNGILVGGAVGLGSGCGPGTGCGTAG